MPTTPEAQALVSYLEAHLTNYLEQLRQLCAIECPTASKVGVDEAGAWVRSWVAAHGWELRDWPDAAVGDSLVATVHGSEKPRIMLVAHLDTVYPVGVAAERPVRIEGDTLLGPGSADNKSG
ncbi:MAG TPA: hypothetical protein VF909_02270, partial [Roseiflexaceae bacterium]